MSLHDGHDRREYYRIKAIIALEFSASARLQDCVQTGRNRAARGLNMRLLPSLLLFVAVSAAAQTIIVPVGTQGTSTLPLPHNGESQRAVLERYGLPDVEHPPVGSPKMTRWDYRDFSVYFENDTVITSVRQHQPKYPQATSAQEQP